MEVANLLIYMILIIVLVSLIGVCGWLLYDYNNLKTQLIGDFKTISNRFSTHRTKDNTLKDSIDINSSNIISTSNVISSNLNTTISNTSNVISSNLNTTIYNTSNVISAELNKSINTINTKTSNHDNNFMTFNDNLNKYFTFGTEESGINANENKIYSYVTDDNSLIDNDKKLKLIHDTVIASELTINGGAKLKTNSDKKLQVCDISGDSCFDIYKDNNNLIIKKPDASGKIIIGDGTLENSLVIESGNLKFKNNVVYHAGTDADSDADSVAAAAAASAASAAAAIAKLGFW